MGQYWYPVNLTKKEFINPHKLASGLKLWEQLAAPGVGRALIILTAAMPEPRGGGDLRGGQEIIGRWAGDRIAIVGDYAEDSDLAPKDKASEIYTCCAEGTFRDVTDEVCAVIESEMDGKFTGDGWRDFVQANADAEV